MKFQIVAQMVKNLPAKQETQFQSLDWEDPLEKKMTTHSSIPEWEIPWTEKPGGVQSTRSQRVGHNQSNTYTHTHTYNIHPWSFKQKTPIFYTIPLAMLLHSFKQITSFFFYHHHLQNLSSWQQRKKNFSSENFPLKSKYWLRSKT